MNEPNNGLPGRYSNNPGQINRLVKLEPIPKKEPPEPDRADSPEASSQVSAQPQAD